MLRGAAFPPAGIIITRGDLVEAELIVAVRPDPLGRVDRPLLQRGVDIAAGDLLRHDAEILQRPARPPADGTSGSTVSNSGTSSVTIIIWNMAFTGWRCCVDALLM